MSDMAIASKLEQRVEYSGILDFSLHTISRFWRLADAGEGPRGRAPPSFNFFHLHKSIYFDLIGASLL